MATRSASLLSPGTVVWVTEPDQHRTVKPSRAAGSGLAAIVVANQREVTQIGNDGRQCWQHELILRLDSHAITVRCDTSPNTPFVLLHPDWPPIRKPQRELVTQRGPFVLGGRGYF